MLQLPPSSIPPQPASVMPGPPIPPLRHGRQTKRVTLSYAVTLVPLLALAPGCKGASEVPPATTDMSTCDPTLCDENCEVGPSSRYRVDRLGIPTQDDIDSGDDLGHDVDGVNTVCEAPDYIGGVDNALIDITFPNCGAAGCSRIDFNYELARAMSCQGNDCAPFGIDIEVAQGNGCAVVRVLDGISGASLGRTLRGPLDGANFIVKGEYLAPSYPHLDTPRCADGTECEVDGAACADASTCRARVVSLDLSFTHVIVSGELTDGGIDDLIVAGVLPREAVERSLSAFLTEIGCESDVAEILEVLPSIYDVQTVGEECDGLSGAWVGSASLR